MIQLAIHPGRPGAPRYPLAEDRPVVVGRSEECQAPVRDDPFLSRRHARFFLDGDSAYVEDLGSSNGTVVNGERIADPRQIVPGDLILLSQTEIRVEEEPDEVQTVNEPLPEDTLLRPLSELLPRDPGAESGGPGTGDTEDGALRRYSDRLRFLNDVHQALSRSIDLESLLEMVLDGAFEHLGPTEGRILLRDDEGDLRVAASRKVGAGDPHPISRTLIREVVEKNHAALVGDTHRDDRFAQAESMLLVMPRALIAAPLADGDGCLGMITVSAPLNHRVFGEEDLSLLASLASVAALRIRNASLVEAVRERERLETELEIARSVQVSLLPRTLPEIPGWELHASNIPSRGVSGDYYQVVRRPSGDEWVLTVADVCGKGMGAALLTATVEAVSSALVEAGEPVTVISARTNAFVYHRTTPDKYATAFLAAVDGGNRIRYVNAGHVTPLVLREGTDVEEIAPSGFPIGLTPDAEYEEGTLDLAPGDILVLYTDGITEAENPAGEEFGLSRFVDLLQRERHRSLTSLDEALDEALDAFTRGVPSLDDRTILLLRRLD